MESATCIVALIDNDNVWIGGDSAGMEPSGDVYIITNEKVFKRHDDRDNFFLFGFTGLYRLGQLLKYQLAIPLIEDDDKKDIMRYMVSKFIPSLRQCLQDAGYEQKESSRAMYKGSFLVAVCNAIFKVDQGYSVTTFSTQYVALGCGESFALGSLYSTEMLPPEVRINKALEAAEKFSGGVQGPFTILTI